MDKYTIKQILDEIGIKADERTKGFNFRCPLCGDSKLNKNKKRGWVLVGNNRYPHYYCFNCDTSMSFAAYLKDKHHEIFLRYFNEFKKIESVEKSHVIEILSNKELIEEDLTPILNKVSFPVLEKQQSILKERMRMNALRYIVNRRLPENKIRELMVGYDEFQYNSVTYKMQNRVIIPYYSNLKELYAFQGRLILDNSYLEKYITFKGNNKIKIYNYFNVDRNKPVIVTEGPIDSFFIDNAISVSGSISPKSEVASFLKREIPILYWSFDNDKPGYEKTVKFMKEGFKCFIGYEKWKNYKDINEIIKAEKKMLTPTYISNIIINNSFSGDLGLARLKILRR